ncbi:MAG: hypothetical protein AAF765_14445 [Bacteroidota bacterium]
MAKSNDIIYHPTVIAIKGYLVAYRSLNSQMEISDMPGAMDERAKDILRSTTKFRKFADSSFVAKRIFLFETLWVNGTALLR